jgi:hypothetical protein
VTRSSPPERERALSRGWLRPGSEEPGHPTTEPRLRPRWCRGSRVSGSRRAVSRRRRCPNVQTLRALPPRRRTKRTASRIGSAIAGLTSSASSMAPARGSRACGSGRSSSTTARSPATPSTRRRIPMATLDLAELRGLMRALRDELSAGASTPSSTSDCRSVPRSPATPTGVCARFPGA